MDPEQTFLRVHARLSGMLSQLLTPRIRLALEYIYLTVAVALFCLLVVMHTNFVQQPGCSSELARIEFTEAQLVQIKIVNGGLWARKADDQNMMDIQKLGTHTESSVIPEVKKDEFTALTAKFWSSWLGSGARRSKLIIKSWKGDRDITEPQNTAGLNTFLDNLKYLHVLRVQHLKPFIAQWLERRSKTVGPTYLYTLEKGYFLLPEGAKSRHNIRTVNITISAQNSCFGNRWQQILINSLVGYDTILMNSLLGSPGQGYLYNFQTKEFYDLSYGHELSEGPARFGDYFVTKCGVLIMSLFVFFTTTMSVSFTLRETQSRMLKFTVQLQHHARHRLPTFQLIFVHVIESLVFVPIMIGILFFLFEFYDDQLLAFLVLSLVWLCELFTMISVRTPISMQFFPRFFLLYFLVFHIYFFSYAYGFSYLAFSATAAFMQHLILYFWNRFEVPALERFMRARGQLQQAGVQITSSTIYTSTLHIARLNVRNNTGELEPESELRSDGSGVAREPADATVDPARPDSNPQQREGGSGSSPLNPFGSLLLWILGGATHHGIVSYFSMFRDRREHGQTNEDPTRHENEPLR